ncbi:MAG: bifunctional oligoribonuclease/PAP phosphatase NrnA [Desulfohalobiaceae bacterium]|nr:bifunctional oligoribonuclease/PAP phosphatase NrnA [Desulfohalobiaceae bacterium]
MNPRSQILEIIRENRKFLILSHTSPDGDAVGSMFALGCILRSLGKEVHLCNESGLPERFSWLAAADQEVLTQVPGDNYDWAFALDCGAASRVGSGIESAVDFRFSINIDHHQGNTLFGAVNWVETRSSVGEMIALLGRDLGLQLSGALGEALYLALVTDSGFFTYSNTTAETLRVAADILEHDLDLDRFNANLLRQWSPGTVKLHGLVLDKAHLAVNGRVGVVTVDRDMLERSGGSWEDTDSLVDYMRRVRGVRVSLCLKEKEPGVVKMSLRSWGEVDVQRIASGLGGGGHANAAGGVLHTGLGEAKDRVIRHIARHMEEASSEAMPEDQAADARSPLP